MPTAVISSADLLSLGDLAESEAVARQLVVLPAIIGKNADVLLPHPGVSLEQALDVAVRTSAPFIVIEITDFDEEEDIPEGAPENIKRAAAEHSEELTGLVIRWVAEGISYSFWAKPDWYSSLLDDIQLWQQQSELDDEAESELYVARARELAEVAVDNELVRATKPAQRKGVIERTLQQVGEAAGDDVDVVGMAARWAGSRVRDVSEQVYAELAEARPALINELRETSEWVEKKNSRASRQIVVRRFLTEKAGGWAPTDVLVKSIDFEAFDTFEV